jgi:hypothetical protein
MFNLRVAAMQNQQARLIPIRRGLLRDQFRRQKKIEISGSHRDQFQVSTVKFQVVTRKSFAGFFMGVFKL